LNLLEKCFQNRFAVNIFEKQNTKFEKPTKTKYKNIKFQKKKYKNNIKTKIQKYSSHDMSLV
jgi:hypothetical protein